MFGDKGGLDDREACLERERPAPEGKRDSIGGGAPCECCVSDWLGWKRETSEDSNVPTSQRLVKASHIQGSSSSAFL